MKIYNLDNVLIPKEVYDAWVEKLGNETEKMMEKYDDFQITEVQEEQFLVFPDGSAQIYVQIRDLRVALTLTKNDYEYRGKN